MNTKLYILLLVLTSTLNTFAQSSINAYKYVTVNERFDFLKSSDQYQLNSLTAFLLKKKGFIVVDKQNNYPQDLAQNNCLNLQANVISVKGFLKTKLQLVLTNCMNTVIFTSEIGSSKLKNYKDAYYEALRKVFELSNFNYTYTGNASPEIPPTPPKPAIQPLARQDSQPLTVAKEVTAAKQAPQVVDSKTSLTVFSGLEIIQTNSGYDFIDSSSNSIKYSVHATLFDNVYIIEGQAGIIYKRGQNWVREYIENGKTTIEALDIKR
ncbi:hypothetical protein N8480_03395 [Flavobacteriaceae bacterium]|nr:hypothetical protein [Flavobacteriaceae bacterium]MDC1355338.1 hypothetical protein [Flavobacteriaceae bacterium]MDC1539698.1 hypothetical protein [Flavobacteriaceae bacterium]